MRHLKLGAWLAVVGAAACSSTITAGDNDPASIILTTPLATIVRGETVQLTWQAKDAAGVVLPDVPVSFTTSSAAIVTVSSTGLVVGAGLGAATVTVRAGSVTHSKTITVSEGGIVSAAGGQVSGYAGAIELNVPAGALAGPTAIRFAASASNPLLDPTEVTGSVYSVSPATLNFAVPATVRVRFNPTAGPVGLPAAAVRLRRFDGVAWVALAQGSGDGTSATGALTEGGFVSAGWVVPDAPCTAPEYRQFDFWLGAWNVTENGQPSGQSDITLVPGGCAVLEHFRSGGIGRSISFYEPGTNKWYQTYVDNGGNRVLLAGTFLNGNMDLLTPPLAGPQHGRTRWFAVGNNARQQVAAPTNNGGTSYGPPQYDFLYVRR